MSKKFARFVRLAQESVHADRETRMTLANDPKSEKIKSLIIVGKEIVIEDPPKFAEAAHLARCFDIACMADGRAQVGFTFIEREDN